MMMIKKLILTNFQKHEKLEIELTPNINIICGQTDSGKSCIVRAIKFLFFNEPKGDVIRREDTIQTSVKAILYNNIEIERIKSKTKNAYVIYRNGEKKEFNAIGKNIPEEIQQVIGLSPLVIDNENIILNISDQISLPFLLDKSATFRNRLFNKLTGSDLTDKALQSLNKDILKTNKEEKIKLEHLEDNKKQLILMKNEKEKKQKAYNDCMVLYKDLYTKLDIYNKLKIYSEDLNRLNSEAAKIEVQINNIKLLDKFELKELYIFIERLENFVNLKFNFDKIQKDLDLCNKETVIENIPNLAEINEKINQLNNLKNWNDNLKNIKNLISESETLIYKLNSDINDKIKKYKELLIKCPKCPTCKQDLNNGIINNIRL